MFCIKNNFFAIGASCIQYFSTYINIGLNQIQQNNPNYDVKNISDIIYDCIANYSNKYLNNIENIINIVGNIKMLSFFTTIQKSVLINKIINDRNLIFANNIKYITDNSFVFEVNRSINCKLFTDCDVSSWKTIKSLFKHVINTKLLNYHSAAKIDVMVDFVLGLNNTTDNNLIIRAVNDILLKQVFESKNIELMGKFYEVIQSVENCVAREMIEYDYNESYKKFWKQHQEQQESAQQIQIIKIEKEKNINLENVRQLQIQKTQQTQKLDNILQSIKTMDDNKQLSYVGLSYSNE